MERRNLKAMHLLRHNSETVYSEQCTSEEIHHYTRSVYPATVSSFPIQSPDANDKGHTHNLNQAHFSNNIKNTNTWLDSPSHKVQDASDRLEALQNIFSLGYIDREEMQRRKKSILNHCIRPHTPMATKTTFSHTLSKVHYSERDLPSQYGNIRDKE